MKCDVHVYAIVRVKCSGIEARDHKEATDKAWGFFPDLYALFDSKNIMHLPEGVADVEFAEEISHFLVDEQNDPGLERSTWHDDQGRPMPSSKAA